VPLDPRVKRFLDVLAAGKPSSMLDTPVAERRLGLAELMKLSGPEAAVGGIEDRTLPGPTGPLAIRIYTPIDAKSGPMAGLIYFHGGGLVAGSIETHDSIARRLANAGACRVISVDYGLAPEHPFPAALDEALAAVTHIGPHAADYGIDAARLGICGDSAGATLAAATAQTLARIGGPPLALQLLMCPILDYSRSTASRRELANGYLVDEATLQPTYELKVGVPGASAGINIARRLGLNQAIIDSARSKLGTQARDVGQFLDKLHADLRAAESDRLRLKAREQELEREKAHLAAEGRKEQQAKVREMEKKLESVLRDFEYQAREAVLAIQDRAAAQKLSKDAERRVAKLRREFREQFDSSVVAHSTGADQGDPHAQPRVVKQVAEGDTVKLKSTGRPARVVRRVDDSHFEVQMGAMKMKIARDDIAEVLASAQAAVGDSPVKAARARGISVSLENEGGSVASEINVIGRTADEAEAEVDRFIEHAFLAGMTQVRVVHGVGMGILRRTLREFLRNHPHVVQVTEPPYNEGGQGATLVELRQ